MTRAHPDGASPRGKTRYLLIITHDDRFEPTTELVAAISAWNRRQTKAGVLVDSNPRRPAADAVTVRVRQGVLLLAEGPFSRSREKMCAYALIEADDRDAAVAVASEHPMAAVATIEVRPVWTSLRGPSKQTH